MGWSFEITGDVLSHFLYLSQLGALLLVLVFVVFPLDSVASVVLALLFGSLAAAVGVGLWRRTADDGDSDGHTHFGTADDITYDPFADPGQAARDNWEKAVRRLPGRDDERD